MIVLFFFLLIVFSAGWMITRAGGNLIVTEGMVIFAAGLGTWFSDVFFDSSLPQWVVPFVILGAGSISGMLGWLIFQGKKERLPFRIIVFDMATHVLVLGTLFHKRTHNLSFERPWTIILLGLTLPVLVFLLLGKSQWGMKIRMAGSGSDQMDRLGYSITIIQLAAWIAGGIIIATAAFLRGFDASLVYGAGYLSFIVYHSLLWVLSRAEKGERT